MKFEKVIEKLGCFISDFVNEINNEIEITFDNYSYCYTDIPTIIVGINPENTKIDLFHQEYYKANGFDYTKYGISFKTFTLLHELGHIESQVSAKAEKNHYKMQKEINDNVKLNGEPLNETLLKYYNLPLEKLADKWAWNYLQDNIYEIKIFDNMYRKLLELLKESE